MAILGFKVLAYITFIAMIVSAVAGLYVYFGYVGVLKDASKKVTLEEALSKVSRLEYTLIDGSNTYTVVVDNDPQSKKGTIEVYSGEELLYTLEYEYSGNSLVSLVNVTANRTQLDPIEYEEAFMTSIYFSQDLSGIINDVKAFPGVGPLFGFQYVSNSLAVDWNRVLSPRGASSPFTIAFRNIESPLGSFRGVEATLSPTGPLLVSSKWAQFFTSFQVAKVNGALVTLRFSMSGTLDVVDVNISYEVTSLESA